MNKPSTPVLLVALLASCLVAAPARAETPRAKPEARPEAKPEPDAAAPAAVDPLEQLRQRLAGRLSRQTLPDGASPYDLKVVARTTAGPAAATTAAPSAPVAAPARVAAPRAAPAARVAAGVAGVSAAAVAAGLPWAYSGPAGPQAWASLKPEYAACAGGQRQSPIDLRGGLPVDLEPVKFEYQASRFTVVDNGLTVQLRLAPGHHIELGGRRFELQHASFHRPGEHRIDGRQFDMSVHLVHKDAEGRIAIVAVQLDKGPALPAVQQVLNHLPLEKGGETVARATLELKDLLPSDRRYFTYMGSLSAPPCSEGVQWVVLRQPLVASAEQLELFARLYPMNARPVQALAGRRILQSN